MKTRFVVLALIVVLTTAHSALSALEIVWTDRNLDKIVRAEVNVWNPMNVVTGLPGPEGIVVDPSTGKLLWGDANLGNIQRANLDGTMFEPDFIVGVGAIRGLAIDPVNKLLYYTSSTGGPGPYIGRADLTSRTFEPLITDPMFVQDATGIALVIPEPYTASLLMCSIFLFALPSRRKKLIVARANYGQRLGRCA
jgi:hypothetical protein